MAKVEGIKVEVSADSSGFESKMKQLNRELGKVSSDTRRLKNEMKFDGAGLNKLNQAIKTTQKELSITKQKQKELTAELKRMEDAGTVDTSRYERLYKQLNSSKSSAARLENELAKLNQQKIDLKTEQAQSELNALTAKAREASQAISAKLGKAGATFQNIGGKIAGVGSALMPVTAAIGGIGAAATKTSMEFESSMSEVQAISGATGKDFEALKSKAKQLGADTAFSSQEAASAMVEMGKAGWSTKDMLSGMDGVMDAAAASGTELGQTATIVADAVSTFGLKAKESSRVADVLAQAANAGTIGMEDLAESFKYVGPVANSLGISIEDTSAGLVALSQAGIKGSQAGTTLKNVFLRLSAPTKEVQSAIDATGLTVENSKGKFVGMNSILTQLRNSTKGMTETQKMMIASQIAGKEGAAGLSALLNMNDKDYKKLTKSMGDCSGQAKETAQTMRDNLKGDLDSAKGSIENLGITLGEALTPYLRTAAQAVQNMANKLNSWLEKFQQLSPAQQDMIVKIGLLVAAIGPALMIVGKLTSGFGTLMTIGSFISGTVIPALATAFAALSAPILAVIAVVGSIVAALTLAYANCEQFRNAINNLASVIMSVVVGALQFLGDLIKAFLTPIIDALVEAWNNSLKPAFVTVANYINNTVVPTIRTLWKWFQSNLAPIFTKVASIVGGVLGSAFKLIGSIIGAVINVVFRCFSAFGQLWNQFSKTSFAKGIVSAFKSILKAINSALGGVKSFINGFSNMVSSVGGFINKIVSAVSDGMGKVGSVLKDIGKLNPFDAGGFGGTYEYAFAAGGFGSSGSINLTANLNITNHGNAVSQANAQVFANDFVDIVNKELGRRLKVR